MPIVPLPIFEQEADPKARGLTEEQAQSLKPPAVPESVVVRYGYMRQIAELPFELDFVPNCHTRLVIKSPRGTELADVLSRSCSSKSCGNVLTHDDIQDYIEQSGGRKYPFTNKGKVIRLANVSDQARMKELEGKKRPYLNRSSEVADELGLDMMFIEAEPILGEERLTLYFKSYDRVDFRELVRVLAREFKTRIEMRQVGARDEARLVADYERCGQHCCCRQFLKVLNRVPMRTAKVQKATLDPLKISGRCGRVMCCLLYEDVTYQDLKQNLPHKQARVGTIEGPGIVIDTQIITQLVLVELEHDHSRIAVKVDELLDPESCPPPKTRNAYAARSSASGRFNGNHDQGAESNGTVQSESDSRIETDMAPAIQDGTTAPQPRADTDSGQPQPSEPKPLRRGRGNQGQSRASRSQAGLQTTNEPGAAPGNRKSSSQPAEGGSGPNDSVVSTGDDPTDEALASSSDSVQTSRPAGGPNDSGLHDSDQLDARKSHKSRRRRSRGGRSGRRQHGKRQGRHKRHGGDRGGGAG